MVTMKCGCGCCREMEWLLPQASISIVDKFVDFESVGMVGIAMKVFRGLGEL